MGKTKSNQWTSQAITQATAKLVKELAELITDREDRLRPCSKHEAIHRAVKDSIQRYKHIKE